MTIKLKENKLLIDGDFLQSLVVDNNEYSDIKDEERREKFLHFDRILARSSGYVYNQDKLLDLIEQLRSGQNPKEIPFGAVYVLRVLDMIDGDKKWETLSADISQETIIDDHNQQWSAAFYSNNISNRNEDVIRHAKERQNHVFSLDDIFGKRSKFDLYFKGKRKVKKDDVVKPHEFFKPFDILSTSYVIYDPYLFTGGEPPRRRLFGGYFHHETNKFTIKSKKPFRVIQNHLTLYLDWIYRCYEKSGKNELPTVYFCGRSLQYNDKQMKEACDGFVKKIKESDNAHPSIEIFKTFLDAGKIKFLYVDNPSYKKQKVILHDNAIMCDYGTIWWSSRKMLFSTPEYIVEDFKHVLDDKATLQILSIFNTFKKGKEGDDQRNFFDRYKHFNELKLMREL